MKLSERLSTAEAGPQPAPAPSSSTATLSAAPAARSLSAPARPEPSRPEPSRPEPSRLAAAAAPAFAEHPDAVRAKGQQPVDAFAALKERAATALFARMGTRFSDSAVREDELRATARDELTRIIDAEQVPLST